MESFLNFLWLLIALAALAAWRVAWVRQSRLAQRTGLQQWVAFSCALVLLFFAVSLTDDLHCNVVVFDECANGRRSLIVGHCIHSSCAHCDAVASAPPAVLAGGLPSIALARFGSLTSLPVSLEIAPEPLHSSGRSPPVSSSV